jgi:aspartate aminotransferase
MEALIGHMGAWAARPAQIATAWLLNHPEEITSYHKVMSKAIDARLGRIYDGIMAMREQGLPVDAIAPQGAIYLSFRVDLIGRGFETNEAIRAYILEEAGMAVVPFQAFDMPEESGWFRISIGAVGLDELDGCMSRLEAAISAAHSG